jgi:hypothetical protein
LNQSSHSRWGVIFAGVFGVVGILLISTVSYWRYVNSVPPFTPQLPPMPNPNGYTQAEQALSLLPAPNRLWPAQEWLKGTPATSNRSYGTPEQLQVSLVSKRPILDRVRATFRLEWRARPVLSLEDGPEEYQATQFAECAHWFAKESLAAHFQGDEATAIQRSLDAMELGSKVPRGGGSLSWLVGRSCHMIGLGQAERQVPTVPASAIPDALARLRRVRDQWPPLSELIENQRLTNLSLHVELFQEYSREPLREKVERLRSMESGPGPGKILRLALTPRQIDLARVDHYYQRQIVESRKPVRERAPVPAPDDPWTARIIVYSRVLDNPWRWERMKTDFALLEAALAVRIHYLEHQQYPQRLVDIDRKWLPTIPVDLWDQPIAYRLRNGRPVIYSLGPDGRDDGGQAADPVKLNPSSRGDLVFGKLVRLGRTRRDRRR